MRSAALFDADSSRRRGDGARNGRPDGARGGRARAPARDVAMPGDVVGRAAPAKWFLHDDRTADDDVAPPRRERRGRGFDDGTEGVEPSLWLYKDPSGKEQGPYPASQLLDWSEQGYFPISLQVRRQGSSRFASLQELMPVLRRAANAASQPATPPAPRPEPARAPAQPRAERSLQSEQREYSAERERRPEREQHNERPHRAEPERAHRSERPYRAEPERAHRSERPYRAEPECEYRSERQYRGEPEREYHGERPYRAEPRRAEPAPRRPQRAHPADALVPEDRRRDSVLPPAERRGRGRAPAQAAAAPPESRNGAGLGSAGEGERKPRRARGRGEKGAKEPAKETMLPGLPYSVETASRLFSAGAQQAAEAPMWRYIDPSGTVQGPFDAGAMLTWYKAFYLHDMNLPVCGTERKVAPPLLPSRELHYTKLGTLLERVKRGQRFIPLSAAVVAADIGASPLPSPSKPQKPKPKPLSDSGWRARVALAVGEDGRVTVKLDPYTVPRRSQPFNTLGGMRIHKDGQCARTTKAQRAATDEPSPRNSEAFSRRRLTAGRALIRARGPTMAPTGNGSAAAPAKRPAALLQAASRASADPAARAAALSALERALRAEPGAREAAAQVLDLWGAALPLLGDRNAAVRQAALPVVGLLGALATRPLAHTGGRPGLLFDWALPLLAPPAGAPTPDFGTQFWAAAALGACLTACDAVTLARYANAVLAACQAVLEADATIANLLPPTLAAMRQAARHTHAVRSRLLDLVDLLLGWSLEPDLPPSTSVRIAETFLSFGDAWRGHAKFSETLARRLTADMEACTGQPPGDAANPQRLLALASSSAAIMQAAAPELATSVPDILPRAAACFQAAAAAPPHAGSVPPSAFLVSLSRLLGAAPASAAADPALLSAQIDLVLHALGDPGAHQGNAPLTPDERQAAVAHNVGLALHVLDQALTRTCLGGHAVPLDVYQRLLNADSPFARLRSHWAPTLAHACKGDLAAIWAAVAPLCLPSGELAAAPGLWLQALALLRCVSEHPAFDPGGAWEPSSPQITAAAGSSRVRAAAGGAAAALAAAACRRPAGQALDAQMAELAVAMLDRQTDPDEAVKCAWAPAVQPLALHLAWATTGLGDGVAEAVLEAAWRRATPRPSPEPMPADDLDRVLAWLLRAPAPQLVAAPRAAASAQPGSPAWLARLAESCGAVAGRACTSGGEAGWALAQAAAGALVEQRLRAMGGGPAHTLSAVEAAIQALPTARARVGAKSGKDPAVTLERAWLLLEFACALEKRLAVACEGCAAAQQPSPGAAAFLSIPKNRKACEEWGARVRPLALLVSARALAALGEPDDVEGLRVHTARVFAPLPGLLTGIASRQAWADSLAWMRGFGAAAAGAHECAAALHSGLIRRAAAAAAPLGTEEAAALVLAAAEAHAALEDWEGLRAWLAELQELRAAAPGLPPAALALPPDDEARFHASAALASSDVVAAQAALRLAAWAPALELDALDALAAEPAARLPASWRPPAQAAATLSQAAQHAWCEVVPQLLARLQHPLAGVRAAAAAVLRCLEQAAPAAVLFPVLREAALAVSSASAARGELAALAAELRRARPAAAAGAELLMGEAARVAVLWEEQWHATLQDVQADVARRAPAVAAEAVRLAGLAPEERDRLLAERYAVVMAPTAAAVEARLRETVDAVPATPAEAAFAQRYKARLRGALRALKHPVRGAEPAADALQLLRALCDSLAQRLGRGDRHRALAELSPALAALAGTDVPMPCAEDGSDGGAGAVSVEAVAGDVVVLPTKTRPKRLRLLGSDGRARPFLLKGREDLRLDERLVQLLRGANALLRATPSAAARQLAAPTFGVVPLGARLGLLQWVEGGVPLWGLFRAWQARPRGRREGGPDAARSGAGKVLSGAEIFYARLLPALEAAGLSRATPRAAWPAQLLRGVFLGLARDAPRDLVLRELWAAAGSAADAWRRRAAFRQSTAAMSIVGWLLGLGDRHPGNLLLDTRSGTLVHIDFGVLFERGRGLRVPEIVPFRLTQCLTAALGIAGVEGAFRAACEAALGALRAGGPALGGLLAGSLADPLVDWAAERDDRHARQGQDLAVALALFASRHAQLAPALEGALGALPGALCGAAAALEALSAAARRAGRSGRALLEAEQRQEDLQAALDVSTARQTGAAEALARAEQALPRLRRDSAQLSSTAAAAAYECRAWAEGHARTAGGLQRGIPKELALAPEFWLSSAAQAPLRLVADGGSPAAGGAPSLLAVAVERARERPAALLPPALAAAAAAADQEGQALLARRDKAAHAATAALQEYTAALQLVLPARYAASTHHARWGAALAAGVATARAGDVSADLPVHAESDAFQAAWALAPSQAPDEAAAAEALADWRARVRALEEGARAAESMQGRAYAALDALAGARSDAERARPAALQALQHAAGNVRSSGGIDGRLHGVRSAVARYAADALDELAAWAAPGAPGALFQLTALASGAAAVCATLREAGLAAAVPTNPGKPLDCDPAAPDGLERVAGAVCSALGVLEAALAAAAGAEVAALPELGACACAPAWPDMLRDMGAIHGCRQEMAATAAALKEAHAAAAAEKASQQQSRAIALHEQAAALAADVESAARAAGAMAETLRELARRAREAHLTLASGIAELPLALAHMAAALPCAAPEGSGGGAKAAAGLASALAPHLDTAGRLRDVAARASDFDGALRELTATAAAEATALQQEHIGAGAARSSAQGASEAPTASSGASASQSAAESFEGPGSRDIPKRTPTPPPGDVVGASPPATLGGSTRDPSYDPAPPAASSAAAHASRRQRDRRAFAGTVLARFWAKLDGVADAPGARGSNSALTVAEQVEVLLRQATSVDALAHMYEGWTPWL
ncbi:hypothetical protein WJX81_005370 [Elliptochloris bilobata]|uniref:non-specific serine/threonine protein kinase n=1 Tax=Elliptochloris bilobata TaxID=381761 RepID=A0AAW1QL25_9CHLO